MFGRRRHPRGSLARPALVGEVCTCGDPAVRVFDDPRLGAPFGTCLALDAGAHRRMGACPFCGISGPHRTAGICPAYVLRPAWDTEPAQRVLAATAITRGEVISR